MKHKFSRSVRYVPEWNDNHKLAVDQQMVAQIKPLKVDNLIRLVDALGGVKSVADPSALQTTDLSKVVVECGDILPAHVTLSGLEDEDGPVPIEDIIQYPVYIGLAAELLMRCASVSMPSESAEGNSGKPPA